MIKSKETEISQSRNLVAEKTTITGNIETIGDFRIDGTLNGDISVNGRLVLGNGGKIKGNVVATEAEIAGNLEGDVKIKQMLTVRATARIDGNVAISKLLVEAGGIFNAKCVMGKLDTSLHSGKKK